jgi:hypothetical protein
MRSALLKHAMSAIARSSRARRIRLRRVAPVGSCRMLASATALGRTRHGPLLRPADDLQPQILCILWLDARNGLEIIREQASTFHCTRQYSKKTLRGGGKEACPGPSRDLHRGQNLRPAEAAAIQELLSKNSLPRERYFVTRIVPRSPGRQLCRRGIIRQKLPSLFQRRPRAGTLTS